MRLILYVHICACPKEIETVIYTLFEYVEYWVKSINTERFRSNHLERLLLSVALDRHIMQL